MLFVVEELTRSFQQRLVWPALLMASGAALVSNLGGQPMFALGINVSPIGETEQLLWSVPIGLGAGLLGGSFARLLVLATRWLTPLVRVQPLRVGLVAGLGLTLLALLTGGASGGDGETTDADDPRSGQRAARSTWTWFGVLGSRLLGPCWPSRPVCPAGLIDPSFTLGGVFGAGVVQTLAGDPHLGVALGMAGGLAGATQLPVMTIAFAVRMAGDQQLMAGLVATAAIATYAGRLVQPRPVYHALADLIALEGGRRPQRAQRRCQRAPRR